MPEGNPALDGKWTKCAIFAATLRVPKEIRDCPFWFWRRFRPEIERQKWTKEHFCPLSSHSRTIWSKICPIPDRKDSFLSLSPGVKKSHILLRAKEKALQSIACLHRLSGRGKRRDGQRTMERLAAEMPGITAACPRDCRHRFITG